MSQTPQDPEHPDSVGESPQEPAEPVQAVPPIGASEPPPVYQHQASAPPPPVVRRPPLITRSDVAASARDALIPLGILLVLVFGIVAGLAVLISSTAHGGFHDWFTSTVILTAGALGASSNLSFGSTLGTGAGTSSGSGPSLGSGSGSGGFDVGSLAFNVSFEVSLTVWIITFALLAVWAWRARRSEAASPSASPVQLLARSALSAVGVGLVLLILALVSQTSNLYGLNDALLGNSLGSGSGSGFTPDSGGNVLGGSGSSGGTSGFSGLGGSAAMHASVGVNPGWVLFGPLLLALIACVVGRLAAIARRPAGDPGGEWVRKLIAPWRGTRAVLWTQVRAVAVLTGLTVLIYAEYNLLNSADTPGRAKIALTLILVLLLPNLALGGMLTGFGVTLYAGAAVLGLAGAGATGIGLFGDSRPWLIWLLIFEAVLGTALPWILVRTRRRAVLATAFSPGQGWRAALIGAVVGFAVAMLGQASISGSLGLAAFGAGDATAGAIYSVFGAILAGAIWFLAAYLAVALHVTPRAVPAPAAAEVPPPAYPYAWPATAPAAAPEPTSEAAAPTTAPPPAAETAPAPEHPSPAPAPEETPGGDQNP